MIARRLLGALVVCAVLAAPMAAHAQTDDRAGFRVHYGIDGGITAATVAISFLVSKIPVDAAKTWNSELLGLDLRVRKNFSASAAGASDALVAVTIAAPLIATLGAGIDDRAGRRALLYGESLGASLMLNAIVKYTVQRPRPYTYNKHPRVVAYTEEAGKDSRLSFYSGHAALSFTAAVSGSYLFALSTDDKKARAVMWGVEVALASMTANLRVVAGKHFYSDVIVGAVMGTAVGFLVPALHADSRGVYRPSGVEFAAMAGGLVAGTTLAHLLPFKQDIKIRLDEHTEARATFVPVAFEHGGGLMMAGSF